MADGIKRMDATKDGNKDLTDFSLRLSVSARDIFFLPKRRRDAEGYLYFYIKTHFIFFKAGASIAGDLNFA